MSARSRGVAVFVWIFASSLLAFAASSEIYQWTDEQGRAHFTQNLDEVPRKHRPRAESSAKSRDGLQTYSTASPPSRSSAAPARYAVQQLGGPMQIPFERQGTLMKVNVKLNDSVTAPFLIDTGASGISIPYSVAQQLGIRIDESTPRQMVLTANGKVAEPLVRLHAVQLGPARVENLEALVSGSMNVGLLGGSFFNNFVYQVDSAAGVMLLSPNVNVASGFTREQWRERFVAVRQPLARLEAALDRGGFVSEERVSQLEQRRAELLAELDALEWDASKSNVPEEWRY
jgi:clan AA aspartic protease (TIGR02281 family)